MDGLARKKRLIVHRPDQVHQSKYIWLVDSGDKIKLVDHIQTDSFRR